MKEECSIERVYEMLIKIVEDHKCPLCGFYIYYDGLFKSRHLPFVEDDGNAITAGIICGYENAQRLTLLHCVKGSGKISDKTEIY